MDTRSLARRSHLHSEAGFTVCIKVRPPRKLEEPQRQPSGPGVAKPTRTGAPGPSRRKPQVFVRPDAVATAPPSYPGRPRRQGTGAPTSCGYLPGIPRRPAGARSSEPGLSASSPATRFPPLPAPPLRLTRAGSGESLAAAARRLGAVAEAAGVAGARGGGRGGGAAEGPAQHQPQGTLPPPSFHHRAPSPRQSACASLATGQGRVGNLATALCHCHRTCTRGHAEPQTTLR